MSVKKPILIETPHASRENLSGSLDLLQGCWKSSSLLWMQSNGFPVLPGLILSDWAGDTEAAVSRFCQERGFSELLLRIEKPGQRWTRRRGGYTIPLSGVADQVEELASEGMLAILLEPVSPYLDTFSLTLVCDIETGKVDVEVVGPGFDASDILRSDILPHERFEVFLGNREVKSMSLSQLQINRSYLVGREDYKSSLQRRLVKIGSRRRNPSFPDEMMGAASGLEQATLIEEATDFLKTSGQTAILEHREYAPIPPRLLNLFLRELLLLFERIRTAKMEWKLLSVASSFVHQDRLVIWDFFSPQDYDTMVLARL